MVLREGGVLISEKELKKINGDFEKNKKMWRERKRQVHPLFVWFLDGHEHLLALCVCVQCLDVMGMILENAPLKKKDFMVGPCFFLSSMWIRVSRILFNRRRSAWRLTRMLESTRRMRCDRNQIPPLSFSLK